MFDDDDDDMVDLPSNARNSQRTVVVSPPRPKTKTEDVLFVDVEGTPSENESPMAGTKRKAESPPSAHQVVSVSVPTVRSTMLEEDSNPVKLKIKVGLTACLLTYIAWLIGSSQYCTLPYICHNNHTCFNKCTTRSFSMLYGETS